MTKPLLIPMGNKYEQLGFLNCPLHVTKPQKTLYFTLKFWTRQKAPESR